MENFTNIIFKWHLNQNSHTQTIVNNLFTNNTVYPSNKHNKLRKLPTPPEDRVLRKSLTYTEKLECTVFVLSTLFIMLVVFMLCNV